MSEVEDELLRMNIPESANESFVQSEGILLN